MNLRIPRASTLLLAALLLALFAATPIPLALAVTVLGWALHTPAALIAGIVAVLGYKATHPKAAGR